MICVSCVDVTAPNSAQPNATSSLRHCNSLSSQSTNFATQDIRESGHAVHQFKSQRYTEYNTVQRTCRAAKRTALLGSGKSPCEPPIYATHTPCNKGTYCTFAV